MRALPILVLILLASPATALLAPAPAVVEFPPDVKDADVLLLLTAHAGMRVERLPIPVPEAGLTLPMIVERLAARGGATLASEEAAIFADVDPLLAAPLLTLLVAVEEAWIIRDAAFAGVPEAELDAARDAIIRGEPTSVEPLLSDDEMEELYAAAIMLSDTIESVVIPQLDAAADAGVWPANAIADPVGVLRIGGTGNDVDPLNRVVQIDARGDDIYYGNAGASTLLSDFDPRTSDIPVAVALDLRGNDIYDARGNRLLPTTGSGPFGVGIHYDLNGADTYLCSLFCNGAANSGIGIHRDAAGDDTYRVWDNMLGYGSHGIGYARNDNGDDLYAVRFDGGGYTYIRGVGLLWDRAGQDQHETTSGNPLQWGYALQGGFAWFVDETDSTDTWTDTANGHPHPYACDECIWTAGGEGGIGHGNDGNGGLAYLLSHQATLNPVG